MAPSSANKTLHLFQRPYFCCFIHYVRWTGATRGPQKNALWGWETLAYINTCLAQNGDAAAYY